MTQQDAEYVQGEISANRRIRQIAWLVIGVLTVFLLGLGSGYLKWGQDETAALKQQGELQPLCRNRSIQRMDTPCPFLMEISALD